MTNMNIAPSRLPAEWTDLTAEWLTETLTPNHPGVRVGEVHVLMIDDGTNRRARLGLSYLEGDGPQTVFAKAEGPHRVLHSRNGNLFNEPDLFASGVSLPLDHPLVYRVEIDRPALDYLIVMEDVTARGGEPRDSTRPLSVEQAASGLRGLAALHSRYWGFDGRGRPELAWVRTWEPTEGFRSGLASRVPTGIERAADLVPEVVTALGGAAVVEMWARTVRTFAQGTMTLLHGDAHIGNTYVLPGDGMGFLDWQVVRRGNWSQDVGYFLVGALTESDRRSAETDLVEDYRRALDVPDGSRPGRDEAWLRYRASAAYGLAIWLSTLGTDGFQSRQVSLTLAERYSAAFVDLETTGALAALGA